MTDKNRTGSHPARRSGMLLALAALPCAIAASPPAAAQPARAAAAVLTMEQASERSSRVSDVSYDLDFTLDGEAPEYEGRVVVRFALADAGDDLTLDFEGGKIASATVNGTGIDARYNGFYLTLPASALETGANSVDVRFSRPYSADGSGLYRFEDPEDGRHYLYTDFEPYDQNRLFPSFDQPDLKARYATRVTAPADWHVVSIVAESQVSHDGANRTWVFPQSLPISTYIYALHAGDYRVWESEAGDIPLRLFVRHALANYVVPEDWFTFTRQGFEFFEEYFGIPYPFGKYDQVIVPHFNAGAMENVGAVTFSERFLRRGSYTRQDRRAIASVVLHEMAHMWFGDLVTMEWWNGLWLNESFATFMSVLAMTEATEFTDEWLESYRDTVRAYRADERDTTHAIDLPIADTDGAFANFDAITYEKGSATLIQLNRLVGPETFRRGVSEYLKAHAYDNTTLEDFLGAISDAAGRDLDRWADEWLREPGTNVVEVELECRGAEIAGLAVVQSAPPEWPTLRTHRAQLGFYGFDSGEVTVRTLPVTYSGARTVVDEAAGLPCPDMVHPNHGAWDFARARLDEDALPRLREHLHGFDDALTRLMLGQSVWDMALEARLPLPEYLDFALDNLAGESEPSVEYHVLGTVQTALGYLEQMDTAALARLGPRIETYLWDRVSSAEAGTDRQLVMFDNYVAAVTSEPGLDRLANLLGGDVAPPAGLTVDQDRRWTLLQTLAAHGHAEAARLLERERGRDTSDEGRRRALAVEVSPPDADLKERWVARLLDASADTTLAEFRAAAGALFPGNQHELQLRFADRLIAALPDLSRERDPAFFAAYARSLLGPLCSADYLAAIENAIAGSARLHPVLQRELKDVRFETNRCLEIARAAGRE